MSALSGGVSSVGSVDHCLSGNSSPARTSPTANYNHKISGIPCVAAASRYTAPVHIDVGGSIYTSSLETLTKFVYLPCLSFILLKTNLFLELILIDLMFYLFCNNLRSKLEIKGMFSFSQNPFRDRALENQMIGK